MNLFHALLHREKRGLGGKHWTEKIKADRNELMSTLLKRNNSPDISRDG